jgi:hypothetical protein
MERPVPLITALMAASAALSTPRPARSDGDDAAAAGAAPRATAAALAAPPSTGVRLTRSQYALLVNARLDENKRADWLRVEQLARERVAARDASSGVVSASAGDGAGARQPEEGAAVPPHARLGASLRGHASGVAASAEGSMTADSRGFAPRALLPSAAPASERRPSFSGSMRWGD